MTTTTPAPAQSQPETPTTARASRGWPRTPRQRRTVGAALAVLLLGLPFLLGGFWLVTAVLAVIAAAGSLSLNLLIGYTGQVSVGHAFFVGLGAYSSAWALGEGWPISAALLLAIALPAVAGALVGPIALRLRELYLAFATLALVFIGEWLLINLPSITGGSAGRSFPAVQLFGVELEGSTVVGGLAFDRDAKYYWLALAVTAAIGFAVHNIARSRTGRAFMAIRDRELAASVAGVDVLRAKTTAFAVSSGMAGLTGAVLGAYLGFLVPDSFGLSRSIEYIAMVIAGGFGSVLGSVLGAAFVVLIPQVLEEFGDQLPLVSDLGIETAPLSAFAYGAVIVLFLVFEPDGLAGLWHRLARRIGRKTS